MDARDADGERRAERSEERDGEHRRLAPRSAALTKSNARDTRAYRSGTPASRSSLFFSHFSSAATTAIVRVSEAGTCAPPSPPRARGGSGGCDAPDVPSACQSRQKQASSDGRPSAPPGDDVMMLVGQTRSRQKRSRGWSSTRNQGRIFMIASVAIPLQAPGCAAVRRSDPAVQRLSRMPGLSPPASSASPVP